MRGDFTLAAGGNFSVEIFFFFNSKFALLLKVNSFGSSTCKIPEYINVGCSAFLTDDAEKSA